MAQPQPEGILVRKIIRVIQAAGGIAVKTHPAQAQRGLPDINATLPPNGHTLVLEVKQPHTKGTVSVAQRAWLDRYTAAGATAAVVTSPQEAAQLIIQIRQQEQAQ